MSSIVSGLVVVPSDVITAPRSNRPKINSRHQAELPLYIKTPDRTQICVVPDRSNKLWSVGQLEPRSHAHADVRMTPCLVQLMPRKSNSQLHAGRFQETRVNIE